MSRLLKDQTITLGHTTIPIAGIGTHKSNTESLLRAVKKGFLLFDTAKVYGTEAAVGEMLQHADHARLTITTKFAGTHLANRSALHRAMEDSRKLLGTTPDFVLIHGPYPDIAMIAIARELEQMVQQGKMRRWGVSNFDREHLQFLAEHGLTPSMNQVEYHPFFQRPELLQFCQKRAIILQAYRAVARGSALQHPIIQQLAQQYTVDAPVIVYNWLRQQGMPFITSVNSPAHLDTYAQSPCLTLTAEDMAVIATLHEPGDRGRTSIKEWHVPFTDEVRQRWTAPLT